MGIWSFGALYAFQGVLLYSKLLVVDKEKGAWGGIQIEEPSQAVDIRWNGGFFNAVFKIQQEGQNKGAVNQ